MWLITTNNCIGRSQLGSTKDEQELRFYRRISQSALVAGDRNEIRLTPGTMSHTSRETDRVEITHAIRTLRELLEKLDTKDRGKIHTALADANEEAQRPKPDKEEVAGALERVVKYAKTANNIGEVVVELKRPLSNHCSLGWHDSSDCGAAVWSGAVESSCKNSMRRTP